MARLERTTRSVATVLAVTGLVAALAGCASGTPEPAEPTPAPTAPEATPQLRETAPPLGLDVRYIDEDGNFKVLRVPDLPR